MGVVDAFEPRDFAEVLGGILTGVLDAQARAARATVDFINEVGLVQKAAGGAEELRTVSFGYRKLDEAQAEAEFELEVPLLSLLQIPLISVKTAKIEFSYDVDRVEESEGSHAIQNKPLAKIVGKIRKKAPTTTSSVRLEEKAGLSVTVELERGEAPVGLDRLLDILEVAAADRQVLKA